MANARKTSGWRAAFIALGALGVTNLGGGLSSHIQDLPFDWLGGPAQAKPAASPTLLSSADVSWLFPAPLKRADLNRVLAIKDLVSKDPKNPTQQEPVWPDSAFKQLLAIAASPAGQVDGSARIGLPKDALAIDAWHIAGIRIDAGAPGLSKDIIEQFGQSPQIRLIVQPVIKNAAGEPEIQDIAVHLIYTFTDGEDAPAQPGCFPRPKPDTAAFKQIVVELTDLKTKLAAGRFGRHRVTTTNAALGAHPGLTDATTRDGVRVAMKAFLERHLSGARLRAMAIMGLPAAKAEPWIFLSMAPIPAGVSPLLPNGGFIPVHGPALDGTQFAQMLAPGASGNKVVPKPSPNNLNPITCQHAALIQPVPEPAKRKGVSTADLFAGQTPGPAEIKTILDTIADPVKSHFFNTDCVSCHTDTRRSIELLKTKAIAGVDTKALPNGPWNVRNFGWSPPIEGPVQATVSRRTAEETAEVVKFINASLAAK